MWIGESNSMEEATNNSFHSPIALHQRKRMENFFEKHAVIQNNSWIVLLEADWKEYYNSN